MQLNRHTRIQSFWNKKETSTKLGESLETKKNREITGEAGDARRKNKEIARLQKQLWRTKNDWNA